MRNIKSIGLYVFCLIFGGFISYLFFHLPPKKADRPVVDVEVKVPKHILIRDTIEKPVIKYKYIYRNRVCCCGKCDADTLKYR